MNFKLPEEKNCLNTTNNYHNHLAPLAPPKDNTNFLWYSSIPQNEFNHGLPSNIEHTNMNIAYPYLEKNNNYHHQQPQPMQSQIQQQQQYRPIMNYIIPEFNPNNNLINLPSINNLNIPNDDNSNSNNSKLNQNSYPCQYLSPLQNTQSLDGYNDYMNKSQNYYNLLPSNANMSNNNNNNNINKNPSTPPTNSVSMYPQTPQRSKQLNALPHRYSSKNYVSHNDIVHRFKNSRYMQKFNYDIADDEVDGFVTWKKKDDALLKYLRMEEGLSWKSIAKFFPSRTVSACQCRLKRLMKKQKSLQ